MEHDGILNELLVVYAIAALVVFTFHRPFLSSMGGQADTVPEVPGHPTGFPELGARNDGRRPGELPT